jgi:hypothetical protein
VAQLVDWAETALLDGEFADQDADAQEPRKDKSGHGSP